jgi:group I intron endonuclease
MVIYKTTNLVNGKIYIGQDKYNDPRYLGSGKILHFAFEKHGIENFKKEIVEVCETQEILNQREKFWISYYNSTDRKVGYNIAKGGNGGDTLSNHPDKHDIGKRIGESNKKIWSDSEYRGKISELRKIQFTEETRQKISMNSSGENNGMYGRTHDTVAKDKMSDAKKKWWNNLSESKREEIGEKISEANIGKTGNVWTEEQKKTHSKWMKENNPFEGKNHTDEVKQRISLANSGKHKSEETKRKLSEANKGHKPVNMVKIQIEGVIYESLTDASIKTGINMSTLRNRIRSKNAKYLNYKIYETSK